MVCYLVRHGKDDDTIRGDGAIIRCLKQVSGSRKNWQNSLPNFRSVLSIPVISAEQCRPRK